VKTDDQPWANVACDDGTLGGERGVFG